MTGIRADLEVRDPAGCPVATATATPEETVESVTWARAGDRVTEEVVVRTDGESDADLPPGSTVTGTYDGERVYRFDRAVDECACAAVEGLGYPITDVQAEEGTLLLTMHLADRTELREVVGALRERAGGVRIRCLVAGGDDAGAGGDMVAFDRTRLTDRQVEVLRTAREMGYFDYPRESNATDVAEALDIGLSTFTEHLAAAESKLVGGVVEG